MKLVGRRSGKNELSSGHTEKTFYRFHFRFIIYTVRWMKLYEVQSLTPFLRPETKSPWGILSMEQAPNWGLRIPGSITATSASAPSSPIFFSEIASASLAECAPTFDWEDEQRVPYLIY